MSYPVTVQVSYPARTNRFLGLLGIIGLKQILLFPHMIVLIFVMIWFGIVTWINFFSQLFAGHSIASVMRYQHGVLQWMIRLQAWYTGLVDQYPPFTTKTTPVQQ